MASQHDEEERPEPILLTRSGTSTRWFRTGCQNA